MSVCGKTFLPLVFRVHRIEERICIVLHLRYNLVRKMLLSVGETGKQQEKKRRYPSYDILYLRYSNRKRLSILFKVLTPVFCAYVNYRNEWSSVCQTITLSLIYKG